MVREFTIIDPFLDSLIQHLATQDTRLYEALTRKTKINIDENSSVLTSISTISDLKAIPAPTVGSIYITKGYYTPGDGGHGIYWWNAVDISPDNGGTIIQPNGAPTDGRWNLLYSGIINLKQFGATSDNTGNCTPMLVAAYDALPTDGGIIYAPKGVYKFSTAVSFATVGKRVTIAGDPGSATTFNYTGTGTAFTFNYGNDGTYTLNMGHGLRDLHLLGPSSAGSTKALVVGGSNGAHGFLGLNLRIAGFGTGIEFGSHTWNVKFEHCMIRDNGTNMIFPSSLTEAGENIHFDHCIFADSPSPHTNSVWVQNGEVVFSECSFDQAQLRIGNTSTSAAQVVVKGSHFENPNLGTNYDFITQDNNNGNYLRLIDSFAFQAKSTSGPAQVAQFKGGKVFISGWGMFTQAGSPWTNFAVLSNAVGVEIYGSNDLSGNITGAFFGGSTTGFVVNFSGANTATAVPNNFVIKAGDPSGGGFFDVGGILRGHGLVTSGVIYPGDASVNPSNFQGSCGFWAGDGAPNNSTGANGDLYFRADAGATDAIVYQRRSGSWVKVLAETSFGTWSPTLTGVANISSATESGPFTYCRVGNVVNFSGRVSITPTSAGGTNTALGISLPIPSNFTQSYQGTGNATIAIQDSGKVAADPTNDRMQMTFLSTYTTAEDWCVTGQYQIV